MKTFRSKPSGKSSSSSSPGKKNTPKAGPQAKASPQKTKPSRTTSTPATISAPPAEPSLHPVLAAMVAAVTAHASCSNEVIDCIQQQSGGQDISDNPSLGTIHVNGGLLARCINLALGVNKY